MADTSVPSISGNEINTSAWLVWSLIQEHPDLRKGRDAQTYDGVNGYQWTGSVNALVSRLWPALDDRMLTEASEAEAVKLALNKYLRNSRNLVCRGQGNIRKGVKATWWISEKWNPVTVSRLQDRAETLEEFDPESPFETVREPAAVEAEPTLKELADAAVAEPLDNAPVSLGGPVVCRAQGCGMELRHSGIRSQHEFSHGFHYLDDGTIVTFDPSSPRPTREAVVEMVVAGLLELGEPTAAMYVIDKVKRVDPRASKQLIRDVLRELTDEGTISSRGTKASERYFLRPASKEAFKEVLGSSLVGPVNVGELPVVVPVGAASAIEEAHAAQVLYDYERVDQEWEDEQKAAVPANGFMDRARGFMSDLSAILRELEDLSHVRLEMLRVSRERDTAVAQNAELRSENERLKTDKVATATKHATELAALEAKRAKLKGQLDFLQTKLFGTDDD